MKHETDKPYGLVITDSSENFDTWINRGYISKELRQDLKNSNILIVPIEGFRVKDILVFPDQTEGLFTFIRNRLPSDFKINVCIEERDYKELILHADLLILGTFVVTLIVAPILVNILSEYLKEKILKTNKKRGVKVSLTIVDEKGRSKNLTYEGDAENFGRIMNEVGKLNEEQI